MNSIKEEVSNPRASAKRILKSLYELRTKEQLSDSDFFNIVGETFKMNPKFFMGKLYKNFRNKIVNIIGPEKLMEMEKYIIEKFCLYEDEQILYECQGNIKQTASLEQKPSGKYKADLFAVNVSVRSGNLFFTNNRIIAQGMLKVKCGESSTLWVWAPSLFVFSGGSKRAESKKAIITDSIHQDIPCYGYQFPNKNHMGLSKSNFLHLVAYMVKIRNNKCLISIKPPSSSEREVHMNKIFDLLRKDADEVVNLIKEVHATEISESVKRTDTLNILKTLRKSDEYQQLSDSDFLNIVKETYKLDPELFMNFIYPKMMSWTTFQDVKEEIITLIDKLSKEFVPTKQDDTSIKFIKE